MKQEDIDRVEDMLNNTDGYMGYAYIYPYGGGERKGFVFEQTPDNIAAFVNIYQEAAEKILLTDMVDRLVLDMEGGSIHGCKSEELQKQIIAELALIQTGETEARDIPIISRETYDAYGRWEDGMVTAAELGML